MKNTKAALSVLLSLLLCFTVMLPGFAAQTAKTEVYRENGLLLTNAIEIPDGYQTDVDWSGVSEAILTGVARQDAEIMLNDYAIMYSEANASYIANILYNTPYILGLVKGFSSAVENTEGSEPKQMLVSILPEYQNDCTVNEYNLRLRKVKYTVKQLVEGIQGNAALTDAEKCLLLHDRLAVWCEYDRASANSPANWTAHTAYAALCLKKAVCQGYVLAYIQLLEECGIESYYVPSVALGHSWVKVILDGEPYFIDITWDDPSWDVRGQVNHENFLLSYNAFKENHNVNGTTDYDESPVSTKYDDYNWKGIQSEIIYIDGLFYYINASRSSIEAVTGFDGAAPNRIIDLTVFSSWYRTSDTIYTANYSKLASVGKKLYYTSDSAVYAYDTVLGTTEEVWNITEAGLVDTYRIYGMNILEGTMNVVLNTTPSINDSTYYKNTVQVSVCDHKVFKCISDDPAVICQNGGYVKVLCRDCHYTTDTTLSKGHQWGENSVASHGVGTHTCYSCGATENFAWADAHTYEFTETVAASCTTQGYDLYTCTECTATKKQNYTATTDHLWEVEEQVEATCSAGGYTLYHCSACPSTYKGDYTKALDHDWQKSEVVAPTCSADGYTLYTCSRCPATEKRNKVAKVDHTWVAGEVHAPTCSAEGYTDYECSVCHVTGKGDKVAKIDHTWVAGEVHAPTCTEQGYTDYECSVCHVTGKGDKVNALGHTWVAGEVHAPTCTEQGYTDYECSVCHITGKGDKVDALGHTDENKDNVCDVCEEDIPKEPTFFAKILAFIRKIIDAISSWLDNNKAPDLSGLLGGGGGGGLSGLFG